MNGELFPREQHEREPGAIFSPDRRRRYVLTRHLGRGSRIACFVMLNPSVADEHSTDNTITKCCRFTGYWECDWLMVVNLIPWVSTDPLGLYVLPQADVLRDRETNLSYVERAARAAIESEGLVVCAWGTHGWYLSADLVTLVRLRRLGIPLQCLGTTAEGYPRHPGRIAYQTPLEPYGTVEQLARLQGNLQR